HLEVLRDVRLFLAGLGDYRTDVLFSCHQSAMEPQPSRVGEHPDLLADSVKERVGYCRSHGSDYISVWQHSRLVFQCILARYRAIMRRLLIIQPTVLACLLGAGIGAILSSTMRPSPALADGHTTTAPGPKTPIQEVLHCPLAFAGVHL